VHTEPKDEHTGLGPFLRECYGRYNRPEHVASDPLVIVRDFTDPLERETAALIAASLSYGRVQSIVAGVRKLLERLDGRPRRFLEAKRPLQVRGACHGFRYRFTREDELVALLLGMRRVIHQHGSLERCFEAHARSADVTVLPTLEAFVRELSGSQDGIPGLLPSPAKGSACKRVLLFLRWMVRRDAVDPGGWERQDPAKLVIPLDVHMHRVCLALGLTRRRLADLRTALEVTAGFRRIAPQDPLRYDFALMHMAMVEGVAAMRARLNEIGHC